MGSNANSRNWKGIAISLLVISIVLSFIVLAVVIKRKGKKNLNKTLKNLNFEIPDDIVFNTPSKNSKSPTPNKKGSPRTKRKIKIVLISGSHAINGIFHLFNFFGL